MRRGCGVRAIAAVSPSLKCYVFAYRAQNGIGDRTHRFDGHVAHLPVLARLAIDIVLVSVRSENIIHRKLVVELATVSRLPTLYPYREYVELGGLISYGPSLAENDRRAAGQIDQILKGGKPGDMRILQPTKFELVINLKTARALGLIVPPSLLARADDVIE